MKRKGFTLIELLAVIVILAIIAFIATPIVMNVIDNYKKSAAERSAANIEHAADIYYYQNGGNITFYCNDGVCSNGEKKLEIYGKGPEDGIIKISKEGDIALNSIIINKHICYKDGESYKCEKANKTSETTTNGVLTLNESKSTILSNYIIKGNSYQETRSGKNLFDVSKQNVNDEVTFQNGIYKIPKNGYTYLKIQQLNNNNFIAESSEIITINNGKNATTIKILSGCNQIRIVNETLAIGVTSQILNINENEDITLSFDAVDISGDTFNIKNIQIEKGSVATEYEAYGVMPSPDYPSEIQSVGDLVTEEGPNKGKYEIPVKVIGKNLFDVNNFIETYKPYYAINPLKITKLEGEEVLEIYGGLNSTGREIKYMDNMFKENVQYTFTLDVYDILYNELPAFVFYIFYTDGTYVDVLDSYRKDKIQNWKNIKFTTQKGKNVDYIIHTYGTGAAKSYVKNFQIEEGLVGTEYEPYKEETTSIYLDEPLRRVGDYADYIDFQKSKIVRNIKEINFDGNENWEKNPYGTNAYFLVDNTLFVSKNIKLIYSNHFKGVSYNDRTNDENDIIFIDNSYNGVNVRNTKYIDVSSFKDFLKNNQVKANSVLATPIEETIELPNIPIIKDTTILSIDTKIKPSEVIVDYYK